MAAYIGSVRVDVCMLHSSRVDRFLCLCGSRNQGFFFLIFSPHQELVHKYELFMEVLGFHIRQQSSV